MKYSDDPIWKTDKMLIRYLRMINVMQHICSFLAGVLTSIIVIKGFTK